MRNVCEVCNIPKVKGRCPDCGSSDRAAADTTSKHPPLVSYQCDYMSGTFQCQWGAYSRYPTTIYCPFHVIVLKQDNMKPLDQLELLKAEREYRHTVYTFSSYLSPDDLVRYAKGRTALGGFSEENGERAVKYTPVWHMTLAQQWKLLTGLPLPQNHPLPQQEAEMTV